MNRHAIHAILAALLAAGIPPASANFTTVINLPEDQPSLGGVFLDSNIQVNVSPGGSLLDNIFFGYPQQPEIASENIEVNLLGGTMGTRCEFNANTRLNVSSGTIGSVFMMSGSSFVMTGGTLGRGNFRFNTTVRMSGGTWGDSVYAESNDMRLTGGRIGHNLQIWSPTGFELDGARVGKGMAVNFGGLAKVMSGSFASGVVLDQGRIDWVGGRGGAVDVRPGGRLTLTGGDFRLNGQPVTALPAGLGAGDLFTGTLADGSVVIFSPLAGTFDLPLGDKIAADTLTLIEVPLPPPNPALVIVGPGTPPPSGLRPGNSVVVEPGGHLPECFSAIGASITQNGGSIGEGLDLLDSTAICSAGTLGDEIRLQGSSHLRVNGAAVGSHVIIGPGSRMTLQSGTAGDRIQLPAGARMEVSGGTAGGVQVSGGELGMTGGSIGQLEASGGKIRVWQGNLGRILVRDGAEVAIAGANIGDAPNVLGSTVTFSGGAVGNQGQVGAASQVVVNGGTLGDEWVVDGASSLAIHGGAVGEDFTVFPGSKVRLTGGVIGGRFSTGGEVIVSGGVLPSPMYVQSGSFSLLGTSFTLDGVDLTPGMVAGVPMTISQRNVILSGVLRDGTPFSLPLTEGPNDADGDWVLDTWVDPMATLTITLVTDPATAIAAEMQAAGFSGDDLLPGAEPFGDGVSNLLKYAFNLPPGQAGGAVMPPGGTAGLPSIAFERIDGRVRVSIEYLRRADGSLDYRPRKSATLEPGSWIDPPVPRLITAADPGWERVRIEEWLDPATTFRQFYRVEVVIP
jgi:hypothetical protein